MPAATWFYARRQALGLSLRQVSVPLDICYETIRKWERGTAIPNLRLLPELALAYQVSEAEIVNRILELVATRRPDRPQTLAALPGTRGTGRRSHRRGVAHAGA